MKNLVRIDSFINSYYKDDEGILGEIYEEALRNNVPVIKKVTRELMKVLLLCNKPLRILEIGTAVGYSSLFMSNYLNEEAKIVTIELDAKRYLVAKDNINKLSKSHTIEIINGDALSVIKEMKDEFDFIFVDAAKGQYINYLEDVMRLLKVGGMIFSDNVLQDGEVLESHYLVEKRNRTIHSRMREYLYEINNCEQLETSILSVGDGVALSLKIK